MPQKALRLLIPESHTSSHPQKSLTLKGEDKGSAGPRIASVAVMVREKSGNEQKGSLYRCS